MNNKMPVLCPSCACHLEVQGLQCLHCETIIQGHFGIPKIMQLSQEEQTFILDFIINSGSLKNMAHTLQLSYPTVRNMLDDLITKLKQS
jgi:hypothetical protein